MATPDRDPTLTLLLAERRLRARADAYAAALDAGDLEAWPGFFAEDARYAIRTAENAEAGLPLALLEAVGRGGIADRVAALRRTMTFAPRRYRRFVSGLAFAEDGAAWAGTGSLLVVQTLVDRPSEIAVCGRFVDHWRMADDAAPLLLSRVITLDTELMPNALIYPL